MSSSPIRPVNYSLVETSSLSISEDGEMKKNDKRKLPPCRAILTLIGGVFLMILPGSTFVSGNITPYLASYYGIKVSKCSNILPSFTLLSAFFVPVGAHLAHNFHYPRI